MAGLLLSWVLGILEAPLSMTTILIILCAFLLVFWRFQVGRRDGPSNLPPGPWAWPLLGNLPTLIAAAAGGAAEAHETFLRLYKQYGPILSLVVLGKRIVILHGCKAIKDAFSNPLLIDRPVSKIALSINPGMGVTTASGEAWKTQRNLVLRFMRNFSFEVSISQEVDCLTQEFKKRNEKPLKSDHLFHNAVSNIICSVVYGTRYDYDDPKFKELLRLSNRTFELLGSGGILFFMPFAHLISGLVPSLREITQNFKKHNAFTSEALSEHQKDYDGFSEPRDFLYLCLNTKSWTRNSHLCINDMLATVGDLFFAGTETTATTLRWSLLYMIAYPEVQARVQLEMDSIIGRERLPQMSDKPNLPYTEATILEVQRISTIIPLGVPHQAAQDTMLMGYSIPKGTILLPNFWALGHDPEVWPEPHLFKPDRFLGEDGHVTKRDEFMPFSVGRRVCLGEPLAKMELFLFFTGLLHQFTFKSPDNAPPVSFKSIAGFTLAPVPYEMCAILRN